MSITISPHHQDPEPTHAYYDVTFFNDTIFTTVTDTPCHVDTWIDDIERIHRRRLHRLIVGLDVEWRPNHTPNHRNPVATLQLCVGRRCLIFQILHAPYVPQSLVNFLENPNYTFTGVGIGKDVEKLEDDYNFGVANVADVRKMAADVFDEVRLKNAGIRELTSRVLGRDIDKPKRVIMSRWDDEWLNLAQVQYACVDAFLSFEIGRALLTRDY